jgi:hypothetical protein
MSSLSEFEYVEIVATIESHFNDAFSCHKCCSKYSNQKDKEKTEKKSIAFRKGKGCFGPVNNGFLVGIDKESKSVKFSGCPGNYTSLSVNYFIDLNSKYELGVLPYKGTLGDQPAKIIEVFQAISDKTYQKRKEKMERESRKK